MKILWTALALGFLGGAPVVLAETNNLTFSQTQGDDGLSHIDIGVNYVFPGLPPRANNSGAGTVRVTLPSAELTAVSADPGYNCHTESPTTAICSADGTPNDSGGTTFPTSVTIHLLARSCWSAPGGVADVWAAPTDPQTAPDTSLQIDQPDCGPATPAQPVLDTKALECTVPNLKGVPLVSATRRLANAKCARGRVTYKPSPKVKKGRVISQSVKPGKLLKEKTKVDLVVSRG